MKNASNQKISDTERRYILKEASKRLDLSNRRLFLRNAIGLGSLTLLGGCDVVDGWSSERMLGSVSDFNDRVQAWLFNPAQMAREYPQSAITRPFPFNSFYTPNSPEKSPKVDAATYRLEISGMASETAPWTLAQLAALPSFSQITRHICIEGWSAIGKWSGVRFSDFLARIGADRRAKYVTFRCSDNYITSIDMPTALHPQTQLTLRFDDETLPRPYGFPIKLRIPTKLGFKNPKHIRSIDIGNDFTGGYWETYGYNWFSGL
jgi:DMSO/TMAO reductase YedYZ molybdopterin-dependent catalytic subunit